MSDIRRRIGHVHFGPDRQQQYENVLINGCFRVWQRGSTIDSTTSWANSDDTYCADRWCLLSDGNDRADISQETSVVPTGFHSAIKFEVETVGAPSEKFGILQVIESQNCAHLVSDFVNLSFYARTTSGQVENLRAAVISWDSTADTVTSDVVSAWNAEGANPTLVANWTYENTPSNLALNNSYQRFILEKIEIDTASTANIGVFIWVDDTDLAASDVFYVAGVQLEKWYAGREASDFIHRPIQRELELARRYFQKTFPQGTAPAQNLGSVVGCIGAIGDGETDGAGGAHRGDFAADWRFSPTMFSTPTITTFGPKSANSNAENTVDSTDTPVAAFNTGDSGCAFSPNPRDATDEADEMAIHATAEAEL